MPTKLVKPEELGQVQAVVCYRVTDMPIPHRPAEMKNCSECGERVWLASSSPSGIKLLCFQCARAAIAKDGEEPMVFMTEKQAADIGGSYGAKVSELLDAAVKALYPERK